MRKTTQTDLSEADRQALTAVVTGRNTLPRVLGRPQKHVWRAQIVLLTADGCGTMELTRRAGISKTSVWRWQDRFLAEGLPGLLRDKTRRSRISPLSAAVQARVVAAIGFGDVNRFLTGLFDGDLHAKRVLSLANATLGVIRTASLAVNTIGHGLALARGLATKHAIKQVDRLLSNEGIDIDAALSHWVAYVVGPRPSIKVAMDWTDFDADGQTTIMLSLMTRHGRATPLIWLTVETASLKNHRNEYEYQVFVRLADALPAGIKVCIVADRGFGDQKLYRVLTEELKFDHVIRFRGNITVTSADGDVRTATDWVGPGGRATVLRGALMTAERYQVGTVICVRDKGMKQAWCLATSYTDAKASTLKSLYGKRWGIDIDQS
jgi:winged helix-turn helix protein/DDE family transposase